MECRRCDPRVFVAFAAWLALGACDDAPPDASSTLQRAQPLMPNDALGGSNLAGFERAVAPRDFVFSVDHGPHPDFRTEWWYATGNLFAAIDGRRFGYQLTIFRNGLVADESPHRSDWAMRDLWFAHFAVTDVVGERMHGAERFSRAAFGLAGARAAPFRVWLEDWEFVGGLDSGPLRVRAKTDDGSVAVDLVLEVGKPCVLHGEGGLSQKSAAFGNASYYYSYTRMPTAGQITIDGELTEVEGASWFDREWSTSALGAGQIGWDWFALQLDEGRELMSYRLRREDGTIDPVSGGSWIEPDGSVVRLAVADVQVEVLRKWTSPTTNCEYPVAWRIRVPRVGREFEVEAVLDDQEHDFLVRYWEGAVDVRATGRRVGVGYVELTGYPAPKSD